MTSKNSEKEPNWGSTPTLTPEQIILWLEGHRALMFEVWRANPGTREKWEAINLAAASSKYDPSSTTSKVR